MHFWAPAVAIALMTLAGVTQKPAWPAELIVSLLPQIGFAAALVGLILLGLGRPFPAALLFASCAACFFRAQEMLPTPPTPPVQPDVTLAWANVFGKADSFERFVKAARNQNADMILIAERPNAISLQNAKELAPEYQYVYGNIKDSTAAVTLLSRIPVDSYSVIDVVGRKSIYFEFSLGGEAVSVAAVHPTIPISPAKMRRRNDHLLKSAAMLDSRPAKILVGDFNATPWSSAFTDAQRRAGLTRIQPAAASTWVSKLPVLGLPIDHLLLSDRLDGSVHVGDPIGSDHFPLYARIALKISPQSTGD